jgi:DNA replication and repair protein RecF
LRLENLETLNFRNLVNQSISFPNRVSVLVGNNGHGKTSIIEAIYMLAHARSFRAHSAKELVNWESLKQGCSVVGRLSCADGQREICFSYIDGNRTITLNGKNIKKASSFFGQVLVVAFTPDELAIIKGAPSLRRKFSDRIMSMCDSSYPDQLVAYQRALKNRNALLLQKTGPSLITQLQPWNALLARDGRIIAQKRNRFIDEIKEDFKKYHAAISREAQYPEEVEVNYNCHFFSEGRLLSEPEIASIFEKSLEQDIKQGSSTKGVQRDELLICMNFDGKKKEARAAASQGQSRSAAVSLKLAASKYIAQKRGETPIVLLDDVESELDNTRVRALYEVLEELQTQVIITSTELSRELLSGGAQPSAFELRNGEVSP